MDRQGVLLMVTIAIRGATKKMLPSSQEHVYGEYEAVSRFRSLRRIGPPSAEARPHGPRLTSDGLPRWPERPIGSDLGIDMATYQVLDRGVRAHITRSAPDPVPAIENERNEVGQLDSSTPF